MTSGPSLSAVRRVLPPGPPIDPYALAGTDGVVFDSGTTLLVGIGRALVIGLGGGLGAAGAADCVQRALATIACEDDGLPGSAVLAFGALPFDRREPTELVVPEVLYRRNADGEEWVTVIGGSSADDPRGDLLARQRSGGTAGEHGDGPTAPVVVEPLSTDSRFLDMVTTAVAAIRDGELAKVVLARQVDVRFEEPPDLPALLARWRALEPNCTVFSMPTSAGRFVGASPELLVARRGSTVVSRPLAGTTRQGSEQDDAAFRGSSKDAGEHRLVVEAIAASLAPLCSTLDVPDRPELVRLHNVVHLGTAIRGVLRAGGSGAVPSALDLVSVLHPTPAVGGVPLALALSTIDRLEDDRRGHYAGPVGYVDADGDGEWVLGIRAATLHGDTARLAAGVGIVEGSEPAAELVETELKFTAVFNALAPGAEFSTAPSGSVV